MNTQILAPAAVLIVWSIVMLVWMALTRFPAMARMGKGGGGGAGLGKAKPGARGQDLEGRIPDEVNWKAHNYTHLMEQPTLFYAVVVILAIAGSAHDTVIAAWVYTGLRIVHSLWQALVNTLPVRFTLFVLSTLALAYLAVRALFATI
ncbi:MAPEG family protein [Aurantiacibacter zhengii]|uniref:MAPEG family protein n=1 Tax=Aurantiacibacter zhengii TaxID=2307003 RepID=A0A418NPR9_9SPHN|nr:MAPEG family protein [Aurantiacibacter zhengii]RIV84536.1 MAPEG family protein [Aurantiacibacter zhengii]